jgi:hypothetical protein
VEHELASKFLSVIQLSITPVILISGVGAHMITLTNRMGRVVDRTRSLAGSLRKAEAGERSHLDSQLEILWRRAGLLRRAVTFAGFSMLISCLLVLVIFVDALLQRQFGLELVIIFFLSVASLIASLVAFLRDIWVSLHALQLEVEKAREK